MQGGGLPPDAPVAARPPALAFDPRRFERHWHDLHDQVAPAGGIGTAIARLQAKHAAFAAWPGPDTDDALGAIERLLAHVFTARRRLMPVFERIGGARASALIAALAGGAADPVVRIQAFVDAMPGTTSLRREDLREAARLRRSARDFAAECVHARSPDGVPLMTRWMWDRGTQSGALREFVAGGDAMPEVPLGDRLEDFEGAREWLIAQARGLGAWRDLACWVDLVSAQAYGSYLRSVAAGGLGGDFNRGAQPHEHLFKLLGIDDARRGGRSRVVRSAAGEPAPARPG